jgi:hypothetical protein
MSDAQTDAATSSETSEATEVQAAKYPPKWQERVGGFAAAVNKPIEAVSEALATVVGEPSDEALAILGDEESATLSEIKEALAGLKIPTGVLRKNLSILRGPKSQSSSASANTPTLGSILPAVPSDENFLEMLKVGGILKVGEAEVLAAIRAGISDLVGAFQTPEKLLAAMEEFAETHDVMVGESFFEIRKQVASRAYADVLEVLKVPGNFVTDGRKSKFLAKVHSILWLELRAFQNRLGQWQESWNSGSANMGVLMMAMTTQAAGGIMPPGLMQPPDTQPLRQAAEAVIESINKVFVPTGIPIARALAADANRIKKILEDAALPAQVGEIDRENLLKKLGIAVGSDYILMEQSLSRFALAILKLKDLPLGTQEELLYLTSMFQLGSSIPWDRLNGTAGSRR